MLRTALAVTTSAVIAAFPVASAYAHSAPADPTAYQAPIEDFSPNASAPPQVSVLGANVPAPVESVINRLKLWRTGTILSACFLNGGQDLRGFFVSTAQTWISRGGLAINFGNTPSYRDCRGTNDQAIRIAFGYQRGGGWDTGNWSYVGTDATIAAPGPTINIGFAANTGLNQLDQRELRRLVLHELGHALAFEHEHQSPLASCKFDWAKVVPYFQSHYGWDEAKIKFNLGKLAPIPGLQVTAFDPASIMNYSFSAWMFVQTGGQICEIKQNNEPSPTDLSSYAMQYPGRTPVQAPAGAIASPSGQEAQELQAAEQQQDKAIAERGARAVAALQQLLPDEGQRKQAADLISKIAQQQFPNFKMDLQANKVDVGNITQSTSGACNPAVAGVGGNVTINPNCTTTNSTIGTQNNVTGTQNNVQGNQINAPGGVAVGRDVTAPITIGPKQ